MKKDKPVEIFNAKYDILKNEVEKIPDFEILPVYTARDDNFTKQKSFKAIAEKDSDSAVAVVRSRYALVQMKDVFGSVLSQLVNENIEGNVIYFRGRGQLHVFMEGSDVGISVFNSVDASSAIKVYFIKRSDDSTIYLPSAKEYRRLHVGDPLAEVVNFNEMLISANETWTTVVDTMTKTPLTEDIVEGIKESLTTKTLVEAIDGFVNEEPTATLWDLLLVVMKTAAASKFKSDIHREKRLRELSTLLIAFSLKMS